MEAFHDAWYTFLTATKNIYESLKKGANGTTPQSRQWYGSKARERKDDPLLQYVYEARNADEHGLSSSVKRNPGSVRLGVARPGFSSALQFDGVIGGPNTNLRVTSLDGKPIAVGVTLPHVILVPVRARGNRVHHPPAIHLGKPLPSNLPVPVAELALTYLVNLVEEASKLT